MPSPTSTTPAPSPGPDEHVRRLGRAAAAGGSATTCRSSAPTTSPSTWPARGGSARGRGCSAIASASSSVRPSARCSGRVGARRLARAIARSLRGTRGRARTSQMSSAPDCTNTDAPPWRQSAPGPRCPMSTRRPSRKGAIRVGRCASTSRPRRCTGRSAAASARRSRCRSGSIASTSELGQCRPAKRLQLIQERLDLNAELEAAGTKVDLTGLEEEFVKAASGLQPAARASPTRRGASSAWSRPC